MPNHRCFSLFNSLSRLIGYAPSWEYLRGRSLNPPLWATGYPENQRPIVMEVLTTLATAFNLRPDDPFRLLPSDRLLDIYKAAYPKGGEDSLEFEWLAEDLQEVYGVPERECSKLVHATVEQVIAMCLQARHGIEKPAIAPDRN